MTGLVKTVRKNVSEECIVDECQKDCCSVSLQDAPQQRLIIDFDKPGSPLGRNRRRCDYLLVAKEPREKGWVVLLEFKSSREVNITKVLEQLQAGARATEKIVPAVMSIRFRPVLASGNIPKASRREMKAPGTVCFHNCPEPLRWIGCGDPLTKALD